MVFGTIVAIEKRLEEFEDWYEKNAKYVVWIYFFMLILSGVLLSFKQILLAQVFYLLGFVWMGLECSIGWKHSVRKWLKLCLFYNFLFSIILAGMLQGYIKNYVFSLLFILIYMFIWMIFSLIADSKVAILVNE